MKNKLLLASVLSVTALTVAAAAYQQAQITDNNIVNIVPAPIIKQPPVAQNKLQHDQRPKVELVFALDTTSSMSGLIDAAKENIWSIATTMASAQPAPQISIGLVAFRDRGDDYITKRIELSDDLDQIYIQLLGLQAQGGGDGPESVNEALFDAVNKMNWSSDPDSYKVVFLVGDAPGHNDYPNDVPFQVTLAEATKKGIIVNTIQAGNDNNMVQAWQTIASLGRGDTFQVSQQGSAVAVATPFDKEIAVVAESYEETRIYHGSEAEQKIQKERITSSSKMKSVASDSSMARRAKYNLTASGEKNFAGSKELIQSIENNSITLDDIAEADLPAVMRSMEADEQKVYIQKKLQQRQNLKAELQALTEKRDAFIKRELAKSDGGKESLDEKLITTLKKQASAKGMDYSESSSSY
ncbi:MAG: VWA domain-containing protein [Alteromonadales bacterium]|nr:VWA domain-containing protein [Alteromonadales bacterium]